MEDLHGEVHGIVDGEGPDEADERQVEDADDERHASPEAVGHEASEGQDEQSAHAVERASQCPVPILAS